MIYMCEMRMSTVKQKHMIETAETATLNKVVERMRFDHVCNEDIREDCNV